MLRIGIDACLWTECFTEKDLGLITKAKEMGFPVLEIPIVDPDRYPAEQIRDVAKDVGIDIVTSATLTEEQNPISPDPDVRKNAVKTLKKLMELNGVLGSRTFAGVNYAAWNYITGRPRTQQEWDWSVECMREVAQYAKNICDTKICVEVLNRFESFFLNIAEDAVKYCKAVDVDNMRVHLDTFHMIREEESFTKAVEACKGYLGYVHVCESTRGTPGKGMVPYAEFFKALKAIGYDGDCVIEAFDPALEELYAKCSMWRPLAPTAEVMATEGKAYLDGILADVLAGRI